jgi:hypothetical protein
VDPSEIGNALQEKEAGKTHDKSCLDNPSWGERGSWPSFHSEINKLGLASLLRLL